MATRWTIPEIAPRLLTAGELMNAKFAVERTSRPGCPSQPSIVLYCPNENCPVRELVVNLKLYGRREPTRFCCPLCKRGPLNRHGYQRMVMMLRDDR